MTAQLTIFGTLEADYTVKPWRDPGVTRVYPEPAAARDETLEVRGIGSVLKSCTACHAPYRVKPGRTSGSRYCSRQCRGVSSRGVPQRVESPEATTRRLRSKTVDGERGCWLWTRGKDRHGYGRTKCAGDEWLAHRLSYRLHVGPIPDGMVVMHSCDVRACINPAHLSVGAVADNAADMVSKERQARGEGHGRALVDRSAVLEIRERAAHGENKSRLAREFGISPSAVGHIVTRKNWRHVA